MKSKFLFARRKSLIYAAIFVLVAIVSFLTFAYRENNAAESYETSLVRLGDLTVSITATGTLEPEELVDVGARVSGKIISFGKDSKGESIDYGSYVDRNCVLAQIDDSLYISDKKEAEAQLFKAKASLQKVEASLNELKAKYALATTEFNRAEKLRSINAKADYDTYKSEYEVAKANVAIGTAEIDSAKADVIVAEATLERAQQNLDYCTILSPISGVIIDRRVDIGQTVVASMETPSLFLIAKNLKKMEVWVTVNEADIGKIRSGQKVTFTVDSYPDEIFTGKVTKVRLNASVTQNVVSYVVEVSTDNPNGRLLPYMTANVQFEISTRKDILIIPESALNWSPEESVIREKYQEELSKPHPEDNELNVERIIWILQDKRLRPIFVKVGLSDGSMVEVNGKDLKEGMEVLTGVQTQLAESTSGSNPFLPQPPKGK